MEVTKGKQFFGVRYWFRLNNRAALATASAVSRDITACHSGQLKPWKSSGNVWDCGFITLVPITYVWILLEWTWCLLDLGFSVMQMVSAEVIVLLGGSPVDALLIRSQRITAHSI